MKAVIAYGKKLNGAASVPKGPTMVQRELEKKRESLVRSFSIAKNLYSTGKSSTEESDLEEGAEFLQVYYLFSTLRFLRIHLFVVPPTK